MSNETVKITGGLKERVRSLLGGANPTPARLESLLEELEQSRAIIGVGANAPEPAPAPGGPVEADTPPVPGQIVDAEFDDLVGERDPAEPTPDPGPAPAPQDPRDAALHHMRLQNELMMAQITNLTQMVEALKKPATAQDIANARGEGQLPPAIMAPPLSFTSGDPSKWPIGEWFPSPLGPRVWMRVCACCGRGTQHHWHCCICKGGPFHYATPCKQHHDPQRHPFYTKNHFGPGQVWGVGHAVCSKPCMDDYLARMGVVAGVNDAEPVRGMMEPGHPAQEPQRPVTAPMSD